MTKKGFVSILLLLCFMSLFATTTDIVLGGDAGWDSLVYSHNINVTNSGKYGKEAVEIATASEFVSDTTDLLLNFEQTDSFIDLTGNYSIEASNMVPTSYTIMGNFAGLGKGAGGGIQLSGSKESLFGQEGPVGSFSISFWLNPSLSENGEVLFMWDSSRIVNNAPIYQYISIMFYQNHLEWNFSNIFSDYVSFKDIRVISSNSIIPDVWSYHSVSYNENTGLIEYRIDGNIEALAYATKTGKAEGNVYVPTLGAPNTMSICPDYTGRIDDFTISADIRNASSTLNRYSGDGGAIISKPYGPFPVGSSLSSIDSVEAVPSETTIQYFVRGGDNYYEWTKSYPEWIPIENDENIFGVNGKYFQVAAQLFSDGKSTKTPILTEITLSIIEKEASPPPVRVFADAGDGYVDLSWIPGANNTADGYLVYYGDAPGEYLGEIALEGDSPIDVGHRQSYRINGLKNGKAYYFAVSSYAYSPSMIRGPLSTEVYARPLIGKGK